MSSLLHPVGPEPRGTYWRRRAAFLACGLALLLLLWMIGSAAFGSSPTPEGSQGAPQGDVAVSQPTSAAPTTAPLPSVPEGSAAQPPVSTPASSPPPSPPTASPHTTAASQLPSPKPSGSEVRACPDTVLALRVAPKSPTTAVGDGMVINATLTNVGEVACERNVAATVIRVTSGPALVWSSQFCKETAPAAKVVTIKPGKAWSGTFTWPGKVTAAPCPDRQPTAAPGTYRTRGDADGVVSATARFVVR